MRKDSLFSLLDRVVYGGLKFIGIVLIGRALGPSGQGIFSLNLVLWAWAGTIASFGLVIANNYLSAQAENKTKLGVLLGNTLVFSLIVGIILSFVLLLCIDVLGLNLVSEADRFGFVVGVVLHGLQFGLLGLLQGLRKFKIKAFSTAVSLSLFILLILLDSWTGNLSSTAVSNYWLLTVLISIVIWCLACLRSSENSVGLDLRQLKIQLGYSTRSFGYILANAALIRVDVILVSMLLGAKATGIYSIGIYFAEALMYFPAAISTVMLSFSAGVKTISENVYRVISTWYLSILVFAALAIPIVVPMLFPDSYDSAVIVSEGLLFGVYWLGMGSVATYHVFGLGETEIPFKLTLLALVTEVLLLTTLISGLGLLGAVLASAASYTLFGVLIFRVVSSRQRTSFVRLLLPTISAFRRI